jgi:2-(1,2-epoxy-1,2-dihydrophenyl)acetyl-CoA isomerase
MLDLEITADGVARLTLNRPDVLNALSTPMVEELLEALARIKADPAVRVLLLTGQGRAFCAGVDLRDPMMNIEAPAQERGRRFLASMDTGLHALARALADLGKPKVAAVNGPAVGGGAALALAADIVLAAQSAYFQFPFTSQLGLVPDLGGSWHLARRLGPARALGCLMLGERIAAQQAADWGLVWQCLPAEGLSDAALDMAQRLARGAPRALSFLPQLVAQALDHDLQTQLDRERDAQASLVQTQDFIEAVDAFKEKRKPVFKGR